MKLKTIKNMMLPALLSMTLPSYAGDFFDGDEFENGSSGHRISVASLFSVPGEINQVQSRKYTLRHDRDSASFHWLHALNKVSKITEAHAVTHATTNGSLPAAFDVRNLDHRFPYPFDQKQQNSCTGNSLTGLATFVRDVEGLPSEVLSRDFIYYNERDMEGSVNEDEGASLADGILSLCQYGVCSEALYPYSETSDGLRIRPSPEAYADALNNVDLDNLAADHIEQSISAMKHTIAVLQRPFVLGIQLYASFESSEVAQTGIVPMPNVHTEEHLGGHAVLAVGYDDYKQTFTIRNSWGTGWGDGGNFHIPYAYLSNPSLAQDFWTMQKMGKKPGA